MGRNKNENDDFFDELAIEHINEHWYKNEFSSVINEVYNLFQRHLGKHEIIKYYNRLNYFGIDLGVILARRKQNDKDGGLQDFLDQAETKMKSEIEFTIFCKQKRLRELENVLEGQSGPERKIEVKFDSLFKKIVKKFHNSVNAVNQMRDVAIMQIDAIVDFRKTSEATYHELIETLAIDCDKQSPDDFIGKMKLIIANAIFEEAK